MQKKKKIKIKFYLMSIFNAITMNTFASNNHHSKPHSGLIEMDKRKKNRFIA